MDAILSDNLMDRKKMHWTTILNVDIKLYELSISKGFQLIWFDRIV